MCIKITETSISSTTNTYTIPQPCIANVFGNNIGTPMKLITSIINVGCFSNVINLYNEMP